MVKITREQLHIACTKSLEKLFGGSNVLSLTRIDDWHLEFDRDYGFVILKVVYEDREVSIPVNYLAE